MGRLYHTLCHTVSHPDVFHPLRSTLETYHPLLRHSLRATLRHFELQQYWKNFHKSIYSKDLLFHGSQRSLCAQLIALVISYHSKSLIFLPAPQSSLLDLCRLFYHKLINILALWQVESFWKCSVDFLPRSYSHVFPSNSAFMTLCRQTKRY